MPQVVITPWRDHSELIKIRAQFYPPSHSREPDLRRKAVNMVAAWKLRGNLPHAVESTALLTDAVLNDDPEKTSTYSIRAVYSTAFCRFVTGLVDTNQTGPYKKSMYHNAKGIGLPASFVELRHQATHEELPALLVLRQAATRSLLWLWQNYWRSIDIRTGALDDDEQAFADGMLKLKEQFRGILASYLKTNVGIMKIKSQLSFPDGVSSTVQQCVRLCKAKDTVIRVLAQVLLESGFLIPTGKILGTSMENTFWLWEEMLKELSSHQPSFLRILTEEMSIRIIQPSQLDITIDTYREAVYLWLVHILTTDGWAVPSRLARFNSSCVISTCLMNPNYWSRRLATILAIETEDRSIKAQWGDLVQASNAQYGQSPEKELKQVDTNTIKEHVEQVEAQIANLEEHANSESQGRGWVKWKGPWISKPIGMV